MRPIALIESFDRRLYGVEDEYLSFREHQVSYFAWLAPWELSTNRTGSGLVLEKVCEYFYYHEKHKDSKDVPDMDIPAELCLELLMAADYFDGKSYYSLPATL